MESGHEPSQLQLQAVIGFGGKVPNGLKWHPDGDYIVFPLGSTLVLKNTRTQQQVFLHGHTDKVTCVAMSHCGRYIASGQRTEPGTKAPIFLWDFETATSLRPGQDPSVAILHKMLFHKGGITTLDFCHDTSFLASLGCPEDNALCIWEVASGKAVCGTPAGSHAALTVNWFRGRSDRLITGGQFHMRTWELNMERRRLFPEDWKTGSVKRIFTCVALDPTDSRAFCGTTSGDMLEFNLSNGSFAQASKVRFSLGIVCAKYCPGLGGREDTIVVGTGDGAIARLSARDLDVKGVAELMGGVTSLAFPGEDLAAATGGEYQRLLAGTDQGNLYALNAVTLETSLLSTAHSLPITDVCFPHGTSDLFLTASGGEIRLWNSKKCAELLRIQVPNLQCHCIAINKSGTSIVSGWSDGKVRAFLPESGKLQYAIPDAHVDAVTAVAFTHDGNRVVSGGKDGRVRVWSVSGKSQPMEISFKEHKKEVTSIVVSHNDEEAVSASADGSCLLWNIKRGARLNALFSSTIFRSCVYHPDESQLLTAGSDRKITYWDATDCTAIRVMDGSTEEITSIDIEKDGVMFVTAGLDRLVKMWLYDEGDCIAVGSGHSGAINKVKISSDNRRIASVGEEGAIFIWKVPGSDEEEAGSGSSSYEGATGSFAAGGAAAGGRGGAADMGSTGGSSSLRDAAPGAGNFGVPPVKLAAAAKSDLTQLRVTHEPKQKVEGRMKTLLELKAEKEAKEAAQAAKAARMAASTGARR